MSAGEHRRGLDDGDGGFLGVNEKDPPALLREGECARAVNCRFTVGEGEMRLGLAKLPWSNKVVGSTTAPHPFGVVYGTIDYRDGEGLSWLIIAADGKVYKTREGNAASEVTIPEAITDVVRFTQTQSGLVLFRGTDLPAWYLQTLDAGFEPIAQEANVVTGVSSENPSDGTEAIPPAVNGEWINNRLFIPYETDTEKDLLAISDYLNATRYAGVRAQARINQGSSDKLVRFFKFNESTGIAFKEKSIYALYNLTGSLSTMALDEVTREYGLAAELSCVQVGRDADQTPSQVWFLSQKRGVCALVAGEFGRLQVLAVPVSDQLERTISRIDWRYADQAVGAFWSNRFYLAVPLDESKSEGLDLIGGGSYVLSSLTKTVIPGKTYVWRKGATEVSLANGSETLLDSGEFTAQGASVVITGGSGLAITCTLRRCYTGVNNAVLVYDFLRQKWAGYDAGRGLMVKEFRKLPYLGPERLLAVTEDGFINVMEELFYDEVSKESIGANLFTDVSYPGSGILSYAVSAGREYTYVLGANELQLRNGTETLTGPAVGTFVAQGSLVELQGTPAALVTANGRLISWTVEAGDIEMDLLTRGYACQVKSRKRFTSAAADLKWWHPRFAIHARTEGVAEEVPVLPRVEGTYVTKDNQTYVRPFNQAPWDETNWNDDHGRRDRQDYSVTLGETTTPSGSIQAGQRYFVESSDVTSACTVRYNGVDYTNQTTFVGVAGVATYSVQAGSPRVYGPGNYVLLGNNGIEFDQVQEGAEQWKMPATVRGRAVQLRFRSAQGRLVVVGTEVKAERIDRRRGSHQ